MNTVWISQKDYDAIFKAMRWVDRDRSSWVDVAAKESYKGMRIHSFTLCPVSMLPYNIRKERKGAKGKDYGFYPYRLVTSLSGQRSVVRVWRKKHQSRFHIGQVPVLYG